MQIRRALGLELLQHGSAMRAIGFGLLTPDVIVAPTILSLLWTNNSLRADSSSLHAEMDLARHVPIDSARVSAPVAPTEILNRPNEDRTTRGD